MFLHVQIHFCFFHLEETIRSIFDFFIETMWTVWFWSTQENEIQVHSFVINMQSSLNSEFRDIFPVYLYDLDMFLKISHLWVCPVFQLFFFNFFLRTWMFTRNRNISRKMQYNINPFYRNQNLWKMVFFFVNFMYDDILFTFHL